MAQCNPEDAFFDKVPPISLELTSQCNLSCPYCGNPNLTRRKGGISWELLEKLVDECKGGKHNMHMLHGTGEPLLYKKVFDIVKLIRDNDAGDGTFATNGTLMTEDKVRKLLDAGLRQIYISLDSLDPEVYAKTRGANLPKVIENIKNLVRIAPDDFYIQVALMRSKLQTEMDEQMRLFNETFGQHSNLNVRQIENSLFPNASEDFRINPAQKQAACLLPNNFFTITSDGLVSVCCVDQDAKVCLGDLNKQTIEEVWYDEKTQRAFRDIAIGDPGAPTYCSKSCVLKVHPHLENSTEEGMDQARSELLTEMAGIAAPNNPVREKVFFKEAQRLTTNSSHHYNHMGTVLIRNGHPKLAVKYIQKARIKDPDVPLFYLNLGKCYEAMNDPSKARQSYEMGLKRNPGHSQLSERLAAHSF